MPTYEYECKHCRYKFEAFQKITDKPLENCPKCNNKLRKIIGLGLGIIFKGTGFYATDYRKKTPPKADSKQSKPCPNSKDGCQGCQSQ